ncbi:MAG TPA: lamin tail domain-containing protein [Candidatus Limnocylindria bacterium]|nr:lamin tail domain-containing protein [Candidatus Limnocylindria bacterium]
MAGLLSILVLGLGTSQAVALPLADEVGGSEAELDSGAGHLVISEVMTGGASASDEFIEVHNPSTADLPLEGLEIVYVTASGATVTRKAAWAIGSAGVPPGAHVLIANDAGVFGALADIAYANGLAATGGSVALRVIGAASAIDAVGWGNAASIWLEGQPAPAPATGSSLERLPGGSVGSGQDTDDNLVDFFVQSVPDPQNSSSPPIPSASESAAPTESPVASETPQPTASPTLAPSISETPVASASPTPQPTPTPSPTSPMISIGEARAQPDGATVTIEGVALTAGDFADGGGYLVDATAGIAVLVTEGSYARGELLRVTGTVDDRYAQRTIRATGDAIASLGAGSEPLPMDAATGLIGEGLEGQLVEVTGVVSSSVTTLSTGLAWDLDDGSGPSRVLVGIGSGIDTSSWDRGVGLTLVGVVGQRDSSGSGTTGYRIQPRDASDILAVAPVATPSPSPSPQPTATPGSSSATPSASPSGGPAAPLVSIGEARAAATGTRLRIRGVVTAPSGMIESGSAMIQDATAAILVRIGTDVGTLALGQLVELDGTRSTKAGMLTLRVSTAPLYLGTQADPEPVRRATGALGEAEEARLVIVRGAISTAISRPRGGNVSFAIDDSSGPIRVTISSRSDISTASLTRGAWLELRAVLAQETTGSAPSSGYRLWPRTPADLRVLATPVAGSTVSGAAPTTQRGSAIGSLPDAREGAAEASAGQGTAPILARQLATSAPPPVSTGAQEMASEQDVGARAGGLVVSGMGLAALAGLAAWLGRRRGPDDDPSVATESHDEPKAPASEVVQAIPRLSVLRAERDHAQREQRILPPTRGSHARTRSSPRP